MAKQELLEILKEGVEEWNQWREDNPRIELDLSGACLHRVNLRAADLGGANLLHSDLKGADLREAYLKETFFRQTNLACVKFNQARFNKTLFTFLDLSTVEGLDSCEHEAPSSLDLHTFPFQKSLQEISARMWSARNPY
jgi:uncharacterized protein YjbI with pentapeptide repeats